MSYIYVIGHKSPDLDSVAAAIAYAGLKNKINNTDIYKPAVFGNINKETKFVLDKFSFDVPEKIDDASGKEFILVDHNEAIQVADGMENADIHEILDHHQINFDYNKPIRVRVEAWGSSCTIIVDEYDRHGVRIEKGIAGLMLSAILVDTVIAKSPTSTDMDEDAIKKLALIAGIDDWKDYGMELFKVRSSISDLSVEEIIKSDFKDFEIKAGKIGIGQVETVDLEEFTGREDELKEGLEKIRKDGSYHSTILFITDIINEGSRFLVSTSDQGGVEKALGADLNNGKVYLEGVISRKKQVAPKFKEIFDM